MKLPAFTCALLAIVVLYNFTTTPTQEWVQLGSRKVNFGLDRDEIPVSYHEGTFTAIKLEVTDGGLNMHRCVIHFENGTQQEVPLRYEFARGTESRVIDLVGNKRFIKKIIFWYDSKNRQVNRATLTVFGRK